jgi:putative flippase GtrA
MPFKDKINELPDLQKQLIKFFMIGVLATLVDLIVYYFLLQMIPIFELNVDFIGEQFHPDNRDLSKSMSFIIGSLVTYNLNKFWTWKQTDRSNKRFAKFYTLYGFSLLLNVFANKIALYLLFNSAFLEPIPNEFFFAFVFATGTSAVFNFAGQKLWVFSVKKTESMQNEQ